MEAQAVTMVVSSTPVEHHPDLGLWVKREDLCCPGGPHFSKTRGVYAHVAARPEAVVGVLDTSHSQGGWAVARACRLLGKTCRLYYPVRKGDWGRTDVLPQQQAEAYKLGATLVPLPAGRSAVLYHAARAQLAEYAAQFETAAKEAAVCYMMPNALKLPEMVAETAAEVGRTPLPPVACVLVSASSGTIAAGVGLGLLRRGWAGTLVVHQGYDRPVGAMLDYMRRMAGHPVSLGGIHTRVVSGGYAYGDKSRTIHPLPFSSNVYYDMKAVDWWLTRGRDVYGEACLWNIG